MYLSLWGVCDSVIIINIREARLRTGHDINKKYRSDRLCYLHVGSVTHL